MRPYGTYKTQKVKADPLSFIPQEEEEPDYKGLASKCCNAQVRKIYIKNRNGRKIAYCVACGANCTTYTLK